LGDFSLIGRFFTLGGFFKLPTESAQMFGYFFYSKSINLARPIAPFSSASRNLSGLSDFSNQKTKKKLGILFIVSQWMIFYILWPFGLFKNHLVYLTAIWYIVSHFGMSFQEKSGQLANPQNIPNGCKIDQLAKNFTAIWYILWPFGLLFPSLVCFTKKNLSTQLQTICL
jgi:hypothetical protein